MGGLPFSPDKTKMDGWSSYSMTRFEEPCVVLASRRGVAIGGAWGAFCGQRDGMNRVLVMRLARTG